MPKVPDPQLAQQWRDRLRRFDHCDLSVAEFCRLEEYSVASFYHWRRGLRSGQLEYAERTGDGDLDMMW